MHNVIRGATGARLGTIDVLLDPSDSRVCKQGSPVPTYFLRGDINHGTGAFAATTGGNWLITGSSTPLFPRLGTYKDSLELLAEIRY